MIRVEAIIKLSREITINSDKVKTGFRVTIKNGNKGYTSQIIAIDGEDIPLEKETGVYIDIMYGELDIEKFAEITSFEFISGRKVGEGYLCSIKEVYFEEKISDSRKKEIMLIIDNMNKESKFLN